MPAREEKVYAIRGGVGHGVYDSFSDALDAGWYQKQPYGNACAFSAEERTKAEIWIETRKPFPENKAGLFAKEMRQQHIFVRILALGIVTTIFMLVIVKISYWVHDTLDCRNYPANITPPCTYANKLIALVSEKQVHIYNLIGAELLICIGLAYTYFASWL